MKYYIETFGCQQNEADSQRLSAAFAARGMKPARGYKDANYINDEFIISNHEQTNKYILNIIKPLQKTY